MEVDRGNCVAAYEACHVSATMRPMQSRWAMHAGKANHRARLAGSGARMALQIDEIAAERFAAF